MDHLRCYLLQMFPLSPPYLSERRVIPLFQPLVVGIPFQPVTNSRCSQRKGRMISFSPRNTFYCFHTSRSSSVHVKSQENKSQLTQFLSVSTSYPIRKSRLDIKLEVGWGERRKVRRKTFFLCVSPLGKKCRIFLHMMKDHESGNIEGKKRYFEI